MPREPKLQRWTDLIAALLRRNYPATFEELARDVPAYADESKKKDAVMRMFERDKDELRSFGIAIDTIEFEDDSGEASGYRLDRKTFYMPYLSLAASGGKPGTKPRKIEKFWYRALANLVFEPDELTIIAQAAQRVRALGDPVLTEEVESALRKLSFDLPIPEPDTFDDVISMSRAMPYLAERSNPYAAPRENVFEILNEALTRKKRVTFDYHGMSSNADSRRTVEPFGLFFLSAHWYLAARSIDNNEMRNFRLNRMRNVSINTSRSQSADYEIPADFNLREHARAKKPWELGDGDASEAIVDFRGSTGATKAAARLGVAIEGAPDRRKFRLRRVDSFARWLLSFGGEAIPIAPPELVDEFERQVQLTNSVYSSNA
jgi:predicted DNA-binding transcriptional regulator YafY